MRYLTILVAVLSITVCAQAGLTISVSDNYLNPSDTAMISIFGDGMSPQGAYYLGIAEDAPATLDASWMGSLFPLPPEPPIIIMIYPPPGPSGNFVELPFYDTYGTPLLGYLAWNILLHCDGPGTVTVMLIDAYGELMDSESVYQTPEPMTIALLGLGAMVLRRKRQV